VAFRNPDVDAARFMAVATMEKAVTEATGHPHPLEAAQQLLDRGWHPTDLEHFAALVRHALTGGSPLAGSPAAEATTAAQVRRVGGRWFELFEYHARHHGRAVTFEWLRVLTSAPGEVITRLASAAGPGGDPTATLVEATGLLDDLAPLAWAAGIPAIDAVGLNDDTATRARLTRRAEGRGFRFPELTGPLRP
jgi:hypothetical protein